MVTKHVALLASVLVFGSASGALAQQAPLDPTPDHMLYYGAVQVVPPQSAHRAAPAAAHRTPTAASFKPPIDTSGDHMFYYGPIH